MTVAFAVALVLGSCGSDEVADGQGQGLVAHYQLDGDAVDVLDTSPGVVVAARAVPDRNGERGGALRFEGEGSFIEIEHTEAISLTNEFTIAAWINARPSDGSGQFWTIFEKSDPERGGHSRYGLWLRDGLLWSCYEAADNSTQPCADTNVPLPTGEWHHVAAVRSARRLILYLDGQEVANVFVGMRDISQTPFNAFIGTDRYEDPSAWLQAALDEVRIYNRPLAPAEIIELSTS